MDRRSSGAPSDLENSDVAWDLTGSILGLSSCGVSTRADTSTEPVRTGGRSERGRPARANNICAAENLVKRAKFNVKVKGKFCIDKRIVGQHMQVKILE